MYDFTLSLDLVAALLTVCYLAGLVFRSICNSADFLAFDLFGSVSEKRSLQGQNVIRRA